MTLNEEKMDKRRLRSVRSYQKIKSAMLTLLEAGNYLPRVQDLSDETGLSVRTVFRHIEDKEHIIREIAEEATREILPIIMQPYRATDWRGQVQEIVDRRVEVWERVLAVRASAVLQRFRSEYISSLHSSWLDQERSALIAVLPPVVRDDPVLFEALNSALSFNTWQGMRIEQKLDAARTAEVVNLTVARLLKDIEPV